MAYAHKSTVLATFYYFIMPQDYLSERHLPCHLCTMTSLVVLFANHRQEVINLTFVILF